MGKVNIEKYSGGYALLKFFAGLWHNNVFYRKVIVLGRENVSLDYPNIYAPNHQNALMDALAVLFTQKGQLVFLARADIFEKKLIASILYFLKILPVYRIRDGFSSLKGNDEIFNKTVDVLKNKTGLVVLPEGNHEGFRRLRQLKKGICRIAFQAEEAADYALNIRIIPVALEFSHYSRFRQVLTVVYGKPIEVSQYLELYKQSPEIAFNELRSKLSEQMKGIMVHIESEEDYEAIDELRGMINGRYSDDIRSPKIFRDRELISKLKKLKTELPELYQRVCKLALDVKHKAKELSLDYRILEKKKHPLGWLAAGILFLVATFPLYLYGNLFTLTFLEIPNLQIRKIKDLQFHSSVKYGLSVALAIVLTPVLLILSFVFFSPWWLSILIFISLPLAGLFTWNYMLLFRRIRTGFRIRNLISLKNREYLDLKNNHTELLTIIAGLK